MNKLLSIDKIIENLNKQDKKLKLFPIDSDVRNLITLIRTENEKFSISFSIESMFVSGMYIGRIDICGQVSKYINFNSIISYGDRHNLEMIVGCREDINTLIVAGLEHNNLLVNVFCNSK